MPFDTFHRHCQRLGSLAEDDNGAETIAKEQIKEIHPQRFFRWLFITHFTANWSFQAKTLQELKAILILFFVVVCFSIFPSFLTSGECGFDASLEFFLRLYRLPVLTNLEIDSNRSWLWFQKSWGVWWVPQHSVSGAMNQALLLRGGNHALASHKKISPLFYGLWSEICFSLTREEKGNGKRMKRFPIWGCLTSRLITNDAVDRRQ